MDGSIQNAKTDQTMKSTYGTRGFFAPERLGPSPKFKTPVDIYALGVILHMLLGT